MKLVIVVTNSDESSGLGRSELKNEIQRSGAFLIGDITGDIDAALRAATELKCDHLLLEAAVNERRFAEQIEAIAGYRNGFRWLSNVLIISPKVSEYAARRLGEAGIMLGFIRPARPDAIAACLERFWSNSESGSFACADNAGYVNECENSHARSVEALLSRLEVPPCYVGYRYVIDAVELVLKTREQRIMTKTVYPEIGIKYKKSAGSVERAIRFLLRSAYNGRGWRRVFPDLDEQPTNSTFISALADLIK